MSHYKPWEETWHVGQLGVEDEDGVPVLADVFEVFGAVDARLAAAAPDLVRALLAVEWSGRPGDAHCEWCGAPAEDRYTRDGWTPIGEHEDDCPRQAALRKAGVL